MKRNAYSLILMDDVVAAVDRLAAQQGTSRSNLINPDSGGACLLYHTGAANAASVYLSDTGDELGVPRTGAGFRCHAFDSGLGTVQVPSYHSL